MAWWTIKWVSRRRKSWTVSLNLLCMHAREIGENCLLTRLLSATAMPCSAGPRKHDSCRSRRRIVLLRECRAKPIIIHCGDSPLLDKLLVWIWRSFRENKIDDLGQPNFTHKPLAHTHAPDRNDAISCVVCTPTASSTAFSLTTTSNTIWARRWVRRAATCCMHDGPAVLRIALFQDFTAALPSCRQHRPPLHLFLTLSVCFIHQRYHRLCPIAGIRSGLFCTLYCARMGRKTGKSCIGNDGESLILFLA